jgi:aldehyde dehydrogenase (NAD+)
MTVLAGAPVPVDVPAALYIAGEWRPSRGGAVIDVENPATEEVIAQVPDGAKQDVDDAVAAARAALPGWSAADRGERVRYLRLMRKALAARREEFAQVITAEMGAPLTFSRTIQTGMALRALGTLIDELAAPDNPEHIGNCAVYHEPAGVVGAIAPWNYPLGQAVAKVATSLAAGCTVVLKPSELAPLSPALFTRLAHEIGLPPGVLNLVTGRGPGAGQALADHAGVDMISFTGSTATGRQVAASAAATVKKVTLELGGKSASVILPGADLRAAVADTVANCFMNAGQSCTALSRMLVHEPEYDAALALAAESAAGYPVGDPLDPATRLGPLVSARQRQRVLGYIRRGLSDGACLVNGARLVNGASLTADGQDTAGRPARGHFVAPAIFRDVHPDSALAQEEIFGPVLCVLPYRDEREAIEIANNSIYGLAAEVWSLDVERAAAVARRLRAGRVNVNGAPSNPAAPFGGMKQSGVGRELGRYGLAEFQEVKAIHFPEQRT